MISTRLPIESMHYFKQVFAENLNAKTTTIVDGFAKESGDIAVDAALTASFDNVRDAKCAVVIGEDISKDHQVVSFFVKRNLPAGTKLITVMGDDSGLDSFAHVSIKNKKLAEGIENLEKDAKVAEILKASEGVVFIYGDHAAECERCVNAITALAKKFNGKMLNTFDGANSKAADTFALVTPVDMKGVEAAYVALGDEAPSQALSTCLEKVPFVVVQGSYASSISADADVILPTCNWLEQDGHYVNMEGKVTTAKAALQSPDGVSCNAEVLKKIAGTLGLKVSDDWKAAL